MISLFRFFKIIVKKATRMHCGLYDGDRGECGDVHCKYVHGYNVYVHALTHTNHRNWSNSMKLGSRGGGVLGRGLRASPRFSNNQGLLSGQRRWRTYPGPVGGVLALLLSLPLRVRRWGGVASATDDIGPQGSVTVLNHLEALGE